MFFVSFRIEYIRQELLSKIKDQSISHNIFRMQFDGFIICEFYCMFFIEFVIAVKTLLDYTNLFFPNDYKKKAKIIYKYFKDKYGKKKKKTKSFNLN